MNALRDRLREGVIDPLPLMSPTQHVPSSQTELIVAEDAVTV
jgi:hypothetical protein